MTEETIPTPPAGYIYQGYLFADIREKFEETRWWLLFWANLMALIPLGVGVIILWVPYQFYLLLGTPLALFRNPAWSWVVTSLVGLVVILGSMISHELLHALALKLTGHQPWFAIRMGVPHTGIEQGDYLARNHFLIMTMTPLIVMTMGGGLSLLFLPSAIGQLILIALLLNCAASVADLLAVDRVRRWPAKTLFADDIGIRVFTPQSSRITESPSPELEMRLS